MNGLDVENGTRLRLVEVNGRPGYFLHWEDYSYPFITANMGEGDYPPGWMKQTYALIEFSDGVERVDPTDVKFVDDINESLAPFEKKDDNLYPKKDLR